jgi:hypothetical protein
MLGRSGDAVGVLLALIGKVECKVGARSTPIVVGDLLTTLTTPGHAMKAADRSRVFGSIVGRRCSRLPRDAVYSRSFTML